MKMSASPAIHPSRLTPSCKVFSAVTQRATVYVETVPFTTNERLALWALAVALVLPHVWMRGFVRSHEIAMLIFVLMARKRIIGVSRLVPLLAVLFVPLLFVRIFPTGSPTFDLRISVAVYAKLCLFIVFIYALVQRSRNPANALWLMRNVIVPVGLALGVSAILDRYTTTTFFIDWHDFWGTGGHTLYLLSLGFDPLEVDVVQGMGFATRSYDVVNWTLFGLAASYWLKQCGKLRVSRFLLIGASLLFAAFSMPQRGALLSIGLAVATFSLVERRPNERSWKVILIVLTVTTIFAANTLGMQHYQRVWESGLTGVYMEGITALSRALTGGMVEETRYRMMLAEIENQWHNPRLLLVGGGWDFGAGVWSKPHNSYLALLVGGGLISVIPLLIAMIGLLRRTQEERESFSPGAMGVALLVALGAEMFANGYIYTVLEYPAGTLTMWVALMAIMFHVPPQAVQALVKEVS